MTGRHFGLRLSAAVGALIGYGFLCGFLALVAAQVYHWLREGEWAHLGMSEGLRSGLVHCCVRDGDTGRLAALLHWLDAPGKWLGLHKVFEIVPASLALFVVSILGNCIFNYARDRLERPLSPTR